jgi:hypothetical protein
MISRYFKIGLFALAAIPAVLSMGPAAGAQALSVLPVNVQMAPRESPLT